MNVMDRIEKIATKIGEKKTDACLKKRADICGKAEHALRLTSIYMLGVSLVAALGGWAGFSGASTTFLGLASAPFFTIVGSAFAAGVAAICTANTLLKVEQTFESVIRGRELESWQRKVRQGFNDPKPASGVFSAAAAIQNNERIKAPWNMIKTKGKRQIRPFANEV